MILIVGAWNPKLFEYPRGIIKDKPIITLLASVSLLSFLLQIYMNKVPEKTSKTRKQVAAWFLLHLGVPVFILIVTLIVGAWNPKLFEYLRGIIKNKPIFTIIPLFASVSLLLFLLQIYMNKVPEKADKVWKIVAYPVHWVFHLAARFLMLLAILATFLIPLLILFLILIKIHKKTWELIKDVSDKIVQTISSWKLIKNVSDKIVQTISSWEWIKGLSSYIDDAFQIVSLLTSLGLLLFFLKREELYEPVLKVIGRIFQVFRNIRLPKMDVKKSLTETWMYDIKFIWPSIKKTFTEPLKLIPAALLLYIILIFGHHSAKDLKKWQENVTENLDTIRTETANLMILRSSGHPPAYLPSTGKDSISFFSPAYLSSTGKDSIGMDTISFLLTYPYQGDLESKKGICPADSSLNLEWLKFFKKAFSACAGDSLKLKIHGFASAAPVAERESSEYQKTKSDTFNCEIANQRAEALIYFLMLPDSIRYTQERCKAYLDSSRIWGRVENKLCIRKMPDTVAYKEMGFDVTYKSRPSHIPMRSDSLVMKLKRLGFEVAYEPWQSCGEMAKAKPMQDSLRLDLEFLNRSVKITIEGDSCLTKAVSIPDTNSRAGH